MGPMTAPAEVITCVDCGGRGHLISFPAEDGRWEAGEGVTYRCADCLDRWDLVLEEADVNDDPGASAAWRSTTGARDHGRPVRRPLSAGSGPPTPRRAPAPVWA